MLIEHAEPEVVPKPSQRRRGGLRRLGLAVSALLCAIGGWLLFRWQVQPLPQLEFGPPHVEFNAASVPSIPYRGGRFVTKVATFHDELFAYLMLQHYRASKTFQSSEVLMHFDPRRQSTYEIVLVMTSDLLATISRVAQLHAAKEVEAFDWYLNAPGELARDRAETRVFVAAYERPVDTKLEQLPRSVVRHLVQRFIRFKSTTDPRVRQRLESSPTVLHTREAQQLAGDIITIADFYALPLEFFLGIGAMENNYMNVRGDLENTIWKRRPAEDDIVLERKKGRVRVLNDSAGVWQITRESLRWAHRLYLRDTRDYSTLPEHLRPPTELDVRHVSPELLTTYAGLLLRHLLDRFNGDVSLAVGAYNGGPGNPNPRYERGVREVAMYARNVIEHAAALRDEKVKSQLQ